MSEGWQAQGGPGASEAAGPGVSAGEMLRAAREAAGLHVAALAVSLKVPVRKLEALEADQYDLLTDAVFVRALASSVCRALKIDAQPVLERLPQMAAPRLDGTNPGLNTPFRAPSDGAPPTWLDQLTRPVFLAVFALLLGALVLILLPKVQQDGSPGTANASASQAPPQSAASLPPAADAAATDKTTAVASPLVPVAAASAAGQGSGVAGAAKPPVSAAAMPTAGSGAAGALAAPASGLIVFRAKGPSWVEVIDANGVVAIRKLLEQGEAAGASGALPLKVTVGRIDTTEVQVRGKPFDLHSVSNDNVARFQVK
jgi:cytoskeleton protein RodZ